MTFKKIVFFISIFLVLTACKSEADGFQGYVDARYIYVSSNVNGQLETLHVKRGDLIKSGQLLFTLDPDPQQKQLEQAKTQVLSATDELKAAESGLHLADLTLKRQTTLEKHDWVAIQKADEAQAQYDQALARREQARSNLERAKSALAEVQWWVDQKIVSAPKAGYIFDTYYLPGELIVPNLPALSILAPEDIYVIFYVSSKFLGQIKLDRTVQIYVNGLTQPIAAKITYISPQTEYTPPVIFSNETNDKLVYRIEAIPLEPSDYLHPGQPVRVTLE